MHIPFNGCRYCAQRRSNGSARWVNKYGTGSDSDRPQAAIHEGAIDTFLTTAVRIQPRALPLPVLTLCIAALDASGDSEWHFNLSTKGGGFTQRTWLLQATLQDGSIHTVWITIKK